MNPSAAPSTSNYARDTVARGGSQWCALIPDQSHQD